MRKVKYLVANSLDNFIARPDGGVDWLFNDDTNYGMAEFFSSIDCMLLGRKTPPPISQMSLPASRFNCLTNSPAFSEMTVKG